MSEKNEFVYSDKTCCPQCGGAAVRKTTTEGSVYFVSMTNEILDAHFRRIDDIDQVLHDRLRRAENIIVDLRKKLNERNENS